MLADVLRAPVRASAFLGKETLEILRQPRLVLTLVLGPFLILLLFGIGFRNDPRQFRALFVAPPSDSLNPQIEEQATTLSPQFQFVGLTGDTAEALERLRLNQVDLLIIAPPEAESTIRGGQQAMFTVYHNEIDPIQAGYISFVGQLYVAEINRRVLRSVVAQGQAEASTAQSEVAAARAAATTMRESLEGGNLAGALQAQQELDQRLSTLQLAVGASLGLLNGVEQVLGAPAGEDGASTLLARLNALRQANAGLGALSDSQGDFGAEAQTAATMETELGELEALMTEFRNIDPGVLVSPFGTETKGIAVLPPRITDFFAPAVLALLLQHLAVTFGALSVVRERALGTVELFRVSPISAGEALVGKYLSYLLFGGLLAALLTLALKYLMGVPLLGNPWHYGTVLAALLFASLGFGFVISLVAQTDSQAVQYAMLMLLASVFFSGFFIALYMLWEPVRVVSWLLPVTYGIHLLQATMLRGLAPDLLLLGGLTAIGVVLFVIAWVLMRRLMRQR